MSEATTSHTDNTDYTDIFVFFVIIDVLGIKIGRFRKLWDMTRIPKKLEKPKRTEKIIGFCLFRFFEILGINDLPSQNIFF